MKTKDRDLMLGEMHSDIKNIKTNVERINGSLEKTSERSIRNEVKINRFWKISGGLIVGLFASLVMILLTLMR